MSLTVRDAARELELTVAAGSAGLDRTVEGGFAADLLSHVMGQSPGGGLWITLQGHPNVVAVAVLAGLAGVILAGGVQPEPATVARAEQEGIPLLTGTAPVFDLAGRLYALGVRSGC